MLLKAKWVVPITSALIRDGAVVVSGNKIKDIGRSQEILPKYPQEETRDFGQAVLLPGFIDLHTHLEYSVFRGVCDDRSFALWKIQIEEKRRRLKKEDWFISAKLGALEAIQSGITCIADITKTGSSLEAALQWGLRGVIFYEVTGMDPAEVSKIMTRTIKEVNFWQEKVEGSSLSIGISPHSPYTVSPPLFKAVSEWSRENNLLVCLHLAGSKDEYSFVKYGSGPLALTYRKLAGWGDLLWQPMGTSPIKYLEQWDAFEGKVIGVHCIQVDERDIDILAKYDVAIAHCSRCGAKLGMGIAPLESFIRRNLRIGLGTDSPASNNTMDIFDEMRIALLLHRGRTESADDLSAEDFVRMATLGGAQALCLDDKVGSLEKEKFADIIAVDLSQSHQAPVRDPYSALVYTANQENVVFTMVGGRALYDKENREVYKRKEIVAEADPVRSKLRD